MLLSTSWTPALVGTILIVLLSTSWTPALLGTTGPFQRLCAQRPSDYSTLNSLTDFILIVLLMSTSWTAVALLSQDYL